jgi:hypothetical protein
MKFGRLLMAVLFVVLFGTGAQAYIWDDLILENTYGSGANEALLVVDFSDDNSAADAFAWKVLFDGTSISNQNILTIVDTNDDAFTVEWNSGFVNAISYGTYSGPYDPTWANYWWSNNSNDLGETWIGYQGSAGDQGAVGWLYTDAAWPAEPGNPVTPAVPIPASVLLLGSGLLGLIGIRRKRG